jgi:hypothetical protein
MPRPTLATSLAAIGCEERPAPLIESRPVKRTASPLGAPNFSGNRGFYLLKDKGETTLTKGAFKAPAGVFVVKAMDSDSERKSND